MILRNTVLMTVVSGWALGGTSVAAAPDATYQGYALVIKTTPIIEHTKTRVPVQRCTWEQLPSRTRYYPAYNERRVMERRLKRCRTDYKTRIIKNTVGFDVTLIYNGETFSRRTVEHPGTRLPVSI